MGEVKQVYKFELYQIMPVGYENPPRLFWYGLHEPIQDVVDYCAEIWGDECGVSKRVIGEDSLYRVTPSNRLEVTGMYLLRRTQVANMTPANDDGAR